MIAPPCMNKVVELHIAKANVRLLRRPWRIVVNQMKQDFAAELADTVAAEMEIVEAHRLPSNETKLSDR